MKLPLSPVPVALQAPGDANDPTVAGLSFEYDYINPRWPGVTKILQVGTRHALLLLPCC